MLGTAQRRRGFTIVEMLVVLAIIGVLAAILVPTVGIAMRTVRQGAIRTEMSNLSSAIEQYKGKVGEYPIDFSNPSLVFPHIKAISRTAVGNQTVYADWLTAALPNPHYKAGMPAAYQTRRPQTMLQHEAIVFLLSELSTNSQFPLGYRYNTNTNAWELTDYQANGSEWVLTGSKQTFFDFAPGRLVDRDMDGWLEYEPSGVPVPYVYFDARVYRTGLPVGLDFENSTVNVTGVTGAGYAVPYWTNPTTPVNNTSYQLLHCGVDGRFGTIVSATNDPAMRRLYPAGTNFTLDDRDNLANFAETRLDEQLEQ